MPFPMTHLCVAKKVIDLKPNLIKNLPQYYLGSLSPDSVHFRENFKPEYKKVSHLCVGDEKWGEITNNDEWLKNILKFAFEHKNSKDTDFIFGHCVHALADMRNNIEWWIPFKLKHFNSTKLPDYDRLYSSDDSDIIKISHTEDFNSDIELYQTSKFKDEIWSYLESSKGTDSIDIVISDELDKLKNNILYRQFANKPNIDSSTYKYITCQDLLAFIDRTSLFICENL